MFPDLDGLRLEGQNLGPFLVIKYVHQQFQLTRYVNNKSCFPISIFFNEEKIKKDLADF